MAGDAAGDQADAALLIEMLRQGGARTLDMLVLHSGLNG